MASSVILATLLIGIAAMGYAALTALNLETQAEARERQAIRAATAAGASVLLSEAEAMRLAEGWLTEIEDLKKNRKDSQAILSQTQFAVWRATWLAQHQQLETAQRLTAENYDQAKRELGHADSAFMALCNLRIQLLEESGDDPSITAEVYADPLQGLAASDDKTWITPLLPQFATVLVRANRIDEAVSQLDNYVKLQRTQAAPPSQAEMKRLRSAIDSLMNSGKVSEHLISSHQSISDTGRVDASNTSMDNPELANDLKLLQGKWRCEFWEDGKLTERMRVEFAGTDNTTQWVDENDQVIRGRSRRFELTRSGGTKVLTTYLDSSAQVGSTFIYHLSEDELRIVSGMLANQPSLPEIERRVFRRSK